MILEFITLTGKTIGSGFLGGLGSKTIALGMGLNPLSIVAAGGLYYGIKTIFGGVSDAIQPEISKSIQSQLLKLQQKLKTYGKKIKTINVEDENIVSVTTIDDIGQTVPKINAKERRHQRRKLLQQEYKQEQESQKNNGNSLTDKVIEKFNNLSVAELEQFKKLSKEEQKSILENL